MRYRLGRLSSRCSASARPPRFWRIIRFPGQFDMSKPMALKGVISKIDWINPHIYIHLAVKDADGTTATWALATLPTAMMRRAGLTRESLQGKPGEEVTINAVPARDGSKHLGWINKITYADGHSFSPTGQ